MKKVLKGKIATIENFIQSVTEPVENELLTSLKVKLDQMCSRKRNSLTVKIFNWLNKTFCAAAATR